MNSIKHRLHGFQGTWTQGKKGDNSYNNNNNKLSSALVSKVSTARCVFPVMEHEQDCLQSLFLSLHEREERRRRNDKNRGATQRRCHSSLSHQQAPCPYRCTPDPTNNMIVESSSSSAATAAAAAAKASCGRGSFIVLEGVDRCGKTTQVQRLVQKMISMGLAATARRFPDRTTATGKLIDQYLQSNSTLSDESIHLLFSANRWEAAGPLQSTLEAGTHIVCDRYAYSGVAFSSAKPGLSLDWCQAPDRGLPAPDCVVFLDLEPEQAEQRGGYGQERYENADFQARVRQRFAELQNLEQQSKAAVPWHVVNAAQSIQEVENDIWSIVQPLLPVVAQQPVGKLWVDDGDKGSAVDK